MEELYDNGILDQKLYLHWAEVMASRIPGASGRMTWCVAATAWSFLADVQRSVGGRGHPSRR
jgi:hypothetical protein